MFSYLSTFARSGVIALAALSTVPIEASAAPMGRTVLPVAAPSSELAPILVGQGEGAFIYPKGPQGRWDGGGNNWVGGGNNWNGGNYYNGGRYYNGNRHARRHYRRNYRNNYHNNYYGSGLFLGLGLGSAYNYYDGYYGEPAYRPRYRQRVYRTSSAHLDWCYANYRSYRESDNSWKPHRGPRRECVSPYY